MTTAKEKETIATNGSQAEDEEVKRRTWLAAQVALTATAMFGPIASAPPSRRLTADDVEAISNLTAALTTSDRQYGGGRARDQAFHYLRTIVQPALLVADDQPGKGEAFAAATQFILRVASMYRDTNGPDISSTLISKATSYAEESGDPALLAWVLARHGEQDMHEHADRAVVYTDAAVALSRKAPPMARAFLLAKHALALSHVGDRSETLRVLGRMWNAYDQAGRSYEPAWVRPYELGHLLHDEGLCYSNLGMGAQAVAASEESMRAEGRRIQFARPRAFTLHLQAIGHLQNREIDQACSVGHELVQIAARLSSSRINERVNALLWRMIPYQDVAEVRDLREAARLLRVEPSR